jgi:hypothetical protein
MVLRRLPVVLALAVCAWVPSSASAAQAQSSQSWCSAHPSLDPCVVSASYDGTAFNDSDPNYDVFALSSGVSGAAEVLWSVVPAFGGPADLSAELGHTFSITIQTSFVPRVIDGFGTAMTYTRSCGGCAASGGKWLVTITGQPVEVSNQDDCTFPPAGPTCSTVPAKPSQAIFQGEISNYNYASYSGPSYPAGFVKSFYGMDMWTNIAETALPPSLIQSGDQNELAISLADHHFEHDGTTLVHGDFYLRIPATFLATYWGINDPSTLATDGLNASVGAGGGTLSVTVEPGNTGVRVKITGMTFSRRKLMIKLGHVTPRAPTHVKARRLGSSSAKVTFHAAKPRGQKVKGYQLSCRPSRGGPAVTARSTRSPLTISKLAAGPYSCTLRARSKAGYGTVSRRFSIPA